MNSVELAIVVAFVAALLLAVAVALGVMGRLHRARSRSQLLPLIEGSKARLVELDSQLAQGQISQESHDAQSHQLAASLLETTGPVAGPAWIVSRPRLPIALGGLAIAGLLASGLYLALGRSATQEPASETSAGASSTEKPSEPSAHALSQEQLQRMVDQVSAQVQKNPKDATAWAMLAHSYDMLGKFSDASKAYATLVELLPKDAQVLADYADSLAVAHGRTLKGEPMVLINKALALDPKNVKALALAGAAAYERKDYSEALGYWERARAASTEPEFTRQIEVSIAEAKALGSGTALAKGDGMAAGNKAQGPAAGGAFVSGRLSVSEALKSKTSPDDTVFIFARPVQGSRMPVALLRRQVRDLPLDFTLDDSMAMVPDRSLSTLSDVVVGARISKRGDATPQAGDLQGLSAPISVGTKGVKLEIAEVVQ
ncbi:c-type cytochrome biogenesis protein CcmI [Piscinibacter sp.]|uniref:c-type cytochrome biogenesis protein CcmI n=1 Tax=Piscinibacter sp. TaxID=1903157 RepID=UPI003559B5DD